MTILYQTETAKHIRVRLTIATRLALQPAFENGLGAGGGVGPEIKGTFLEGHHIKNDSTSGSVLRSPYTVKLPYWSTLNVSRTLHPPPARAILPVSGNAVLIHLYVRVFKHPMYIIRKRL